jgi:hypothetical protein
MPKVEEHFARAESAGETLSKLAKQLQRASMAMSKGARDGSPAKIRSAVAELQTLSSQIAQSASAAPQAFPLTDEDLAKFVKEDFANELIAAGSAAGVALSQLDNCLAAFPVVLQFLPEAKGVKIDNRRLASLRAKVILEEIKNSLKRSRSQPERFIELLYKAYRLILRDTPEHGTTLLAIYDALTLLPESRKSYGKPEFTRDVYELDVSQVRKTSGGMTMVLSAATGTRSKAETLSIVSPEGMPKYYYGIRFEGTPG